MVNSQDIEVVQGAVRYPRPFHGASLPLPLNYSLRPFFGTRSSRPRRTQQAKGSARSENGGAGGLGGPRWAPGGRSDDYIAPSAKWTRVSFFLFGRFLWAVRVPWYTYHALFVTTKLTSYHKTRYNLPLRADHARTSVKKTDDTHSGARGRCAIDNGTQFASLGRGSTIQDHTAAQPRTAARQTPSPRHVLGAVASHWHT